MKLISVVIVFCPAGGGSGYIRPPLLTKKSMYCYNCQESSEESTKTISTTCNSETPTENCAKKGNGYARITLISVSEWLWEIFPKIISQTVIDKIYGRFCYLKVEIYKKFSIFCHFLKKFSNLWTKIDFGRQYIYMKGKFIAG